MAESSGKAFDFKLFKRLLAFTRPYKLVFYFVALAAIAMSALGVLRPILLQFAIDTAILPKDYDGLVFYIAAMFVVLLLEVIKPLERP